MGRALLLQLILQAVLQAAMGRSTQQSLGLTQLRQQQMLLQRQWMAWLLLMAATQGATGGA